MKIRTYTANDTSPIIELFQLTIHHINKNDYTPQQLAAWAPSEIETSQWEKSLSCHYTLIAEENKQIIGFGDIDSTGYLDRLYTHKDYQNRGIATQIITKLEAYATNLAINKISTRASITAKPFFLKHNYLVIRENTVERNGQYLINFIMEKLIR